MPPALAQLAGLSDRARDLSPVLGGTVNQLVDEMYRRQFATQGAFGGRRWAKLAPITRAIRATRGRGRGGILRDTGRLWASLTKGGGPPDGVKRVTATSLERDTAVPYARFVDSGYLSTTFVLLGQDGQVIPLHRRAPKQIPARPITPDPVPNVIVRRWEQAIAQFIAGGPRAA